MVKALPPPGSVPGPDGGGQDFNISRARGVGCTVSMEDLRQVGWGQVMEGFVGQEKFEMDSLGDGEPVELIEDGGDVVTGPRVGDHVGSRILDVLECFGNF